MSPCNSNSSVIHKPSHAEQIALAVPVHSHAGQHAHQAIHAAAGELANHPLFQKARVTANVVAGNASDRNAHFHEKGPDSTWVKNAAGANLYSNVQGNANPIPRPEVGRHSALNVDQMAAALVRALNAMAMQVYAGNFDTGTDLRVHVNFMAPWAEAMFMRWGRPA